MMTLKTMPALEQNDAELVATTNAVVKLSEGRQFWYLTRFKP